MINQLQIILLLCLGFASGASEADSKGRYLIPDPIITKLGAEIVRHWKFPVETHKVESADGYIITVVRIPRSNSSSNSSDSKSFPAILHHGLLSSMDDWLMLNPDQGLPYMLWKEGFDVWVPSARGTVHSNTHKTLDSKISEQYWDFSFDEIGHYDVPAIIDYVSRTSGAEKVNWIGHSMGCAMFFICMHYQPEYNDKVNKLVALAPAAYVGRSTSLVGRVMSRIPDVALENALDMTWHGQLMPGEAIKLMQLSANQCSEQFRSVCENFLFLICGSNVDHPLNVTQKVLERVGSHTPAITSVRCMTHYLQSMNCKTFGKKVKTRTIGATADEVATGVKQVLQGTKPVLAGSRSLFSSFVKNIQDVGEFGRKLVQGEPLSKCTKEPYSLGSTTVPIFMIYGERDSLVVPEDAEQTLSETGSQALGRVQKAFIRNYQHLDFMYSESAVELVFKPAIKYLMEP